MGLRVLRVDRPAREVLALGSSLIYVFAGTPELAMGADQASESLIVDVTWLNGELRSRVEQAAAHAGLSVTAACEQWLRQGLEQAEQQRALVDTPERCSLRNGICSSGPVPLPVQQ